MRPHWRLPDPRRLPTPHNDLGPAMSDVTTYLVTNQITPFFCFKSSQWIVTPSICKPGKRCDNTIKEISGRHRSRKSALARAGYPNARPECRISALGYRPACHQVGDGRHPRPARRRPRHYSGRRRRVPLRSTLHASVRVRGPSVSSPSLRCAVHARCLRLFGRRRVAVGCFGCAGPIRPQFV